jgi:molecular chaperone DnaK
MPQIEVTFDIDANGILHVSAQDRATGKKQSIRIEASSGLSESEIQKMVREAQQNAEEDKRRRQEIETRNQADQLAYQTEKNLKEYGDKIEADTRAKVEEAVKQVREALKSDSAQSIKSAMENLNSVWHQAASQMYQESGQAQTQNQAEPTGKATGSEKDQGKAVDADYEVVK